MASWRNTRLRTSLNLFRQHSIHVSLRWRSFFNWCCSRVSKRPFVRSSPTACRMRRRGHASALHCWSAFVRWTSRGAPTRSAKMPCSRYAMHTVVPNWESTKPILCSRWGHFDRAKPILKILLASWTFYTIEKGLDLLMLKIWGL